MKKIIASITIISCLISGINAQGVFEKRFSTSYESGISFLGRGLIYDSELLVRHSLDLNYAINRRLTAGISLNFAQKSVDLHEDFSIGNSELSKQSQNFYNIQEIQINDLSMSIKLRFFPKHNGVSAPLGSFFGVSYDFGLQNSFTTSQNPDSTMTSFYNDSGRKSLSVISLTFGRNIAIGQKYLVGFGMTTGYNLTRVDQFRRFGARPFINFGIVF